MATYLHAFRQYDENDVINLFSSESVMDAGTLVKLDTTSGKTFVGDGEVDHVSLGSDTGNSYGNVVSTSFDVKSRIVKAGATDALLGVTLMAIASTDENGEKLLYNPRKAAEMGVVIPGQAVPVMTRGIILYKDGASALTWAPGAVVYAGASGTGLLSATNTNSRVGIALGTGAAAGWVLLKVEL